ncbi:MAG: hypothetical protein EOO40_06320 [Deltaproteobacteria bacterium]|nr:MAG: hypothetical protein EOO40_06320 [Deltaproteobacteria bacterium]
MPSHPADSGVLSRRHQRQLAQMGRRESNDRIHFTAFANGKETVGEMAKRKFVVSAFCPTCQVRMWVDLAVVIALVGPSLTFWNRRSQCKAIDKHRRCQGRVIFYAKLSSGECDWYALRDPPPRLDDRNEVSGHPDPPLPDRVA